MKRSLPFFAILICAVIVTFILQSFQPLRPPEIKKYKVELSLQDWGTNVQHIEYTKNALRQSDLPSRQVAYITDSLLTPLEQEISLQVKRQVELDKPIIKQDSAKNKKQ